jgi:hypothetical protein
MLISIDKILNRKSHVLGNFLILILFKQLLSNKIFLGQEKKVGHNFLFGSFEINSKMWYTPLPNPLCTTFLSLFLHEPKKKLRSILN